MTESAPLSESLAIECARWHLALLEDPEDEALRARWREWLEAEPSRQVAWQHIEDLNQTLSPLSQPLSRELTRNIIEAQTKSSRRQLLRAISALVLVGGSAATSLYGTRQGRIWMADYQTGTAEIRHVRLKDGTHLSLNANSAVDIDYREDRRLIHLRQGDIWIQTAKEKAQRPFRVVTSWGEFEPLGTEFYLRERVPYGALAVYEGAVKLKRGDKQAVVLQAGEEIHFDSGQLGHKQATDRHAIAWQQSMLVAERMPLKRFLEELNHHHRGWLYCDPAVADLMISGTYPLNDVDRVLRAVARTHQLKLIYRTRFWVKLIPA